MAQEKQRLGEEKAGKGWRYRRMLGGKTWTSKVYKTLTRQTKAESWQNFVEFRKQQQDERRTALLSLLKPDGETLDEEAIKASGLSALDASHEVVRQTAIVAFRHLADVLRQMGDQEAVEECLSKMQIMEDKKDLPLTALVDAFRYAKYFPVWKLAKRSLPRIRESQNASLNAKVLADEYVESYHDKAKRKQGSYGQHGLVKSGLKVFVAWLGSDRSMETFNQQDWKNFSESLKKRCDSQEFSSTTAHGYQQVAVNFLHHLGSEFSELTAFRTLNLSSSVHKIRAERKEPVTFTVDEVKALLENSGDRTRLYLLLMLNCAMYQQDISDLLASEIDFAKGRIIRSRSKTRKAKKGNQEPFRFNWLLWPTTRDLLCTLAKTVGVALLNKDGNQLVTHTEDSRRDAMRSAYRRVVDKLKSREVLPKGWNKTLKMLRKTGANIIADCDNAETSVFYSHYLNHSGVAQKHYLTSGRPHAKFDEAVKYIGEKLGQYPADGSRVAEVKAGEAAPENP